MYYIYIIQSENNNRHYVGYTNDIANRLLHHNSGATKSTKAYRPWKLIYTETFDNKKDAWIREQQIKRYKSGEAFKKLIKLGRVA